MATVMARQNIARLFPPPMNQNPLPPPS